jgi:hypothetical protein
MFQEVGLLKIIDKDRFVEQQQFPPSLSVFGDGNFDICRELAEMDPPAPCHLDHPAQAMKTTIST